MREAGVSRRDTGGRTYSATLPAPVPINNFWSFMVYDNQTRSKLETDQRTAGIDSNSLDLVPNNDGSYTIWSVPKRRKAAKATGSKRGPARAGTRSCGSMAHGSSGSTRPGSQVIYSPSSDVGHIRSRPAAAQST
jgi:hypothetical protein